MSSYSGLDGRWQTNLSLIPAAKALIIHPRGSGGVLAALAMAYTVLLMDDLQEHIGMIADIANILFICGSALAVVWKHRDKLLQRRKPVLISAMGEGTGEGFTTISVEGIPSEEQVGAPTVKVQERLPAWEEIMWWYVSLR